jgi:hypothetical protein
VHKVDSVAEGRKPLPRDREGIGVAIESDEAEPGVGLEHRVRVTAHAEGRVDDHRAGRRERRSEQLERALEVHGGVDLFGHSCRPDPGC